VPASVGGKREGRRRCEPLERKPHNGVHMRGPGAYKEDGMQRKCEDCGVWADEEYILNMDGVELCVICVLQLDENGEAREVGGIAE